MSVSKDALETVQKLYIAYYQRPADPQGLMYWAQKLEESGGNLNAIVHAFANSPEAKELYGGKPTEEVIKEIYEAVFNRAPDPEGLNFYKEKVEKGEFSIEDVMLRVLDGAKGDDATILEKKVAAAEKFVEAMFPSDVNGLPDLNAEPVIVKYEGFKDAEEAREWLKKVISNPDAPVPDVDEVKVDLLAIADPDDPLVNQVKDLVVEKPDLIDELKDVVEISPDEKTLQLMDEIKSHIEKLMDQVSGEHPEDIPPVDPESLQQMVAKIDSIKEEVLANTLPQEPLPPEGGEIPLPSEGIPHPETFPSPDESEGNSPEEGTGYSNEVSPEGETEPSPEAEGKPIPPEFKTGFLLIEDTIDSLSHQEIYQHSIRDLELPEESPFYSEDHSLWF